MYKSANVKSFTITKKNGRLKSIIKTLKLLLKEVRQAPWNPSLVAFFSHYILLFTNFQDIVESKLDLRVNTGSAVNIYKGLNIHLNILTFTWIFWVFFYKIICWKFIQEFNVLKNAFLLNLFLFLIYNERILFIKFLIFLLHFQELITHLKL